MVRANEECRPVTGDIPEPVTAETEDLKEYFEERVGILEDDARLPRPRPRWRPRKSWRAYAREAWLSVGQPTGGPGGLLRRARSVARQARPRGCPAPPSVVTVVVTDCRKSSSLTKHLFDPARQAGPCAPPIVRITLRASRKCEDTHVYAIDLAIELSYGNSIACDSEYQYRTTLVRGSR